VLVHETEIQETRSKRQLIQPCGDPVITDPRLAEVVETLMLTID